MKKIFSYLAKFLIKNLYFRTSWKLLKILPPSYPEPTLLNNWYSSQWGDYHAWLQKHSLPSINQLKKYRREIEKWNDFPTFSIITPVYNTTSPVLTETILSVYQQCYPYWQLCIVDDGSTLKETTDTLKSPLTKDPRIDIRHNNSSLGISNASNKALGMAKGQYMVFLDHDDRLSFDALYCLAKEINDKPNTDILYTDRDMIDPKGFRYMHLFKPDWSPETLLSGNYAFHLVCYRYGFLKKIGLLRSQYDGSQDYDLLLRAAEYDPIVTHIPKILYSWRQQETSIAHLPECKEYVFKSGKAALKAALQRRGLKGRVSENSLLWRGNYQIDFEIQQNHDTHLITYTPDTKPGELKKQIKSLPESDSLILLSSAIKNPGQQSINHLIASLAIDKIAITTGKIITIDHKLFHAGLFFTKEGRIFSPYKDCPDSEPGYMAMTSILRNISLPHPMCLALKMEVCHQLSGFRGDCSMETAILDLALRAQQKNWRVIYEPKAIFTLKRKINNEFGTLLEEYHYSQKLKKYFPKGDPYYNPNLSNAKNTISLPFSKI